MARMSPELMAMMELISGEEYIAITEPLVQKQMATGKQGGTPQAREALMEYHKRRRRPKSESDGGW